MKSLDLGNNEQLSVGAIQQADDTWFALTFTASKEFKTKRGAANWMARRGYDLNGNSLAAH
jgi:hypothetical protein